MLPIPALANNNFVANEKLLKQLGNTIDENCDGVVETCPSVCGNGALEPGEECDDGNLINGDGCNSNCSVEANYRCFNGSKTTKSICSYTGPM